MSPTGHDGGDAPSGDSPPDDAPVEPTDADAAPDAPSPSVEDEDASGLDRALDDLEHAIAARGGEPAEAAPAEGDDRQYAIPLLDEVVVPGRAPAPAPRPPRDDAEIARVAERLASEIEVIIQTHLEQEMSRVEHTIRERVREHIAITLPELLDAIDEERG